MARKDRYILPSGMAGLIRYGEEAREQVKVKPKYVIAFCIVIVILEILLRFFG
jgi:preprotein translocase subunit Sec61beta